MVSTPAQGSAFKPAYPSSCREVLPGFATACTPAGVLSCASWCSRLEASRVSILCSSSSGLQIRLEPAIPHHLQEMALHHPEQDEVVMADTDSEDSEAEDEVGRAPPASGCRLRRRRRPCGAGASASAPRRSRHCTDPAKQSTCCCRQCWWGAAASPQATPPTACRCITSCASLLVDE